VFRGGKKTNIDYEELVVGDLYVVETGDKIPADSILIRGDKVECTEADLTGEADARAKEAITIENYKSGSECTLLAKATTP
jgi:Ca2+-transporting ATPase